jgi:hypothetical protein
MLVAGGLERDSSEQNPASLSAGGKMVSDPTPSKQKVPARDARSEARIPALEPVQLASLNHPFITEPTSTQNISSRGARVMTQQVWEPGSLLLIKSLRSDFWARARVVYWRSFSSSRYAIGLEFVAREGKWPRQD